MLANIAPSLVQGHASVHSGGHCALSRSLLENSIRRAIPATNWTTDRFLEGPNDIFALRLIAEPENSVSRRSLARDVPSFWVQADRRDAQLAWIETIPALAKGRLFIFDPPLLNLLCY